MKTFYVGIKGVIVKDNKVLLLRKNPTNSAEFWEMPGGRIDHNEAIEQGVLR